MPTYYISPGFILTLFSHVNLDFPRYFVLQVFLIKICILSLKFEIIAPKLTSLSKVDTFVSTEMYRCLMGETPRKSQLHLTNFPIIVLNEPALQRPHSVTTESIASRSQLWLPRFIIARRVSGEIVLRIEIRRSSGPRFGASISQLSRNLTCACVEL
jgi:hypothetical protein